MSGHHPNILRASSYVKASYWFVDPNINSPAEDIESYLFTHLFCAFADVNRNTYEVDISKNYSQISSFNYIVQLKNPDVQTLLSIGGKMAEPNVIPTMASNADYRKKFIDSSIKVARDNNFYGLDLAWEYPSTKVDMTNFGKLVDEWHKAVNAEADRTRRQPLLLTAAVYYSPVYDSKYDYPVETIANSLDFVNIMSYDLYGPGSSLVTKPPAPLYDPTIIQPDLNGDSGVNQWLEAGLPYKKAVLGFSYLGWAWTLEDPNIHGYNAPTNGADTTISPDGSITNDKLRNYIVDNGAATYHDPAVVGYYCYVGNTWIGYDDNQSIVSKVSYAKLKGLLGYFSWHVGADYKCGLSRAASVAWDTTELITGDGNVAGK